MSRMLAMEPQALAEALALVDRADTARLVAYLDEGEGDEAPAAAAASMIDGVATIAIRGPLVNCGCLAMIVGGMTWDSIRASIAQAKADPNVRAVLLDIDSPGGEVAGMQATGHALRALGKPSLAYISGAGCSAALYLAAAADSIWAARMGAVGCVGVAMMVREGEGEQGRQIVSSLTPHKNRPLSTPEGEASAQLAVNDLAAEMLGDMAAWRGLPDAAAAARFFGAGEVLVATRAHSLGMVAGLSVGVPLHLFNPAGGPPAHTGGVPVDDEIEAEGEALAEEGAEAEEAEMSPEEKQARIEQLEEELRKLKGEPEPEPDAAPGPAALAFADRLVADKAINPAGRAKAARDYQRDPIKAMREAPAAGAAYRAPAGNAVKPKAGPRWKNATEAMVHAKAFAAEKNITLTEATARLCETDAQFNNLITGGAR